MTDPHRRHLTRGEKGIDFRAAYAQHFRRLVGPQKQPIHFENPSRGRICHGRKFQSGLDRCQSFEYALNMPRKNAPSSERQIGPVFDLEGRLDQAVAADRLIIPGRIELQEGCICYQYFPGGPLDSLALNPQHSNKRSGFRSRTDLPLAKSAPPRLVDEFVRLVDAPEEQVLGFARRWGVLDLCSHGLPMKTGRFADDRLWSHDSPGECLPLVWEPQGLDQQLRGYLIGRERLSDWRMWARRARAIMRIAAAVSVNRASALEDWLELRPATMTPARLAEQRANLEKQGALALVDRHALYDQVNYWGEAAGVRPKLISREGGPAMIRFGVGPLGSLLGLIGLQMMVRTTRVGSMAVCSSCGTFYKPDRLPGSSRRNYCANCGRAAAMKDAKRGMMDRKRRALEMHQAGAKPKDIAAAVGSKLDTILRWLKGRKA